MCLITRLAWTAGNPKRFADLLLRQRHVETGAVHPADDPETLAQLDDDVGEPCGRRTLAGIDDPFAKHRGVDQRVPPKHLGNARIAAVQSSQRVVSDEAQRAWRQRRKVVVHHVQEQAHQIGDFAGNVQGEDLALAARNRLGARAKSLDDEAAFGRPLAIAHHRRLRLVLSHRDRKGFDVSDILLRNAGRDAQTPDKRSARSYRRAREVAPLTWIGTMAPGRHRNETRDASVRFQQKLRTRLASAWLASRRKGQAMTKKRNRTRPALSLQERLNKFTQEARAAARKLPAGTERRTLLQKARDAEEAAEMERLLSSPDLQGQK